MTVWDKRVRTEAGPGVAVDAVVQLTVSGITSVDVDDTHHAMVYASCNATNRTCHRDLSGDTAASCKHRTLHLKQHLLIGLDVKCIFVHNFFFFQLPNACF